MNDILLSIIIPAYNSERFLKDLLSDLAEQVIECNAEKVFEIIVVNDGSVDSSIEIIKSFSDKYNFILFIDQENKGECGARNSGIKKAVGKYLYFLDSDDCIPKKTFSFFKKILSETEDADIFLFGYEVYKNNALAKQVYSKILDKKELSNDLIKKTFFSKKMPCCICSLIYKKNFIGTNNLLFPDGIKIGGDMVFMINAFTKASSLYYDKRICFTYKIRDDSVMQGYKGYDMNKIKSFEVIRDTILNSSKEYTLIKKERNFFIANLYLANLVAYLKSNVKDKTINRIFLINKSCIYKKLKGRFINSVAINIARLIPLKLLFKILK